MDGNVAVLGFCVFYFYYWQVLMYVPRGTFYKI